MRTEWFLFVHNTTSILANLSTLSTLVASIVLYSLTWAWLMSPGKDKTRVCRYTLWVYSLSTLENNDENRTRFVRSPHHKDFGKAQHLLLWALWWHQLFSTRHMFAIYIFAIYIYIQGWPTKMSLFFFGNNFYKNKETFRIFSPLIFEVYGILLV